jgi:hypothetical protein
VDVRSPAAIQAASKLLSEKAKESPDGKASATLDYVIKVAPSK